MSLPPFVNVKRVKRENNSRDITSNRMRFVSCFVISGFTCQLFLAYRQFVETHGSPYPRSQGYRNGFTSCGMCFFDKVHIFRYQLHECRFGLRSMLVWLLIFACLVCKVSVVSQTMILVNLNAFSFCSCFFPVLVILRNCFRFSL
jgi:hypothetical protein